MISGLGCESLMKKVVGRINSGLTGLHMKGMLPGKFSIPRNQLALEGQSLQCQLGPVRSKNHNTEKDMINTFFLKFHLS